MTMSLFQLILVDTTEEGTAKSANDDKATSKVGTGGLILDQKKTFTGNLLCACKRR